MFPCLKISVNLSPQSCSIKELGKAPFNPRQQVKPLTGFIFSVSGEAL